MHPVEQIDREAAAIVSVLAEIREFIRAGKCDNGGLVQAFAGHRIAERRAIVEFLRHVPPNMFDEGTIDAIIAGEHAAAIGGDA